MGEINLQNIKSLLSQVLAISEEYEKEARKLGENYNVFNILGLSTREVRTHSAFIADLLNPEGLHGQGSIFLELFIEQLKIGFSFSKDELKSAKIEVERHIGTISDNCTEGGNIDIIIELGGKLIIIENKIYARDQECQLVRYYNYAINSYSKDNFILLYLTLDKQEASDFSTICINKDCREESEREEPIKDDLTKKEIKKLELNQDYFNITYHTTIKEWLKKCLKEIEEKPFLIETLKQYINLVKQLTGQTMNDKMNNKITNILISNSESIKTSFEIEENILTVKKELTKKVLFDIEKYFEKENYKFEVSENCVGFFKDTYFGIYKEGSNFLFGFGFDKAYWSDFYFGIYIRNQGESTKDAAVVNKLENIKKEYSTKYWPYNDYCENLIWDKHVFIKIAEGEFSKMLIEKIKKIKNIYENAIKSVN